MPWNPRNEIDHTAQQALGHTVQAQGHTGVFLDDNPIRRGRGQFATERVGL